MPTAWRCLYVCSCVWLTKWKLLIARLIDPMWCSLMHPWISLCLTYEKAHAPAVANYSRRIVNLKWCLAGCDFTGDLNVTVCNMFVLWLQAVQAVKVAEWCWYRPSCEREIALQFQQFPCEQRVATQTSNLVSLEKAKQNYATNSYLFFATVLL